MLQARLCCAAESNFLFGSTGHQIGFPAPCAFPCFLNSQPDNLLNQYQLSSANGARTTVHSPWQTIIMIPQPWCCSTGTRNPLPRFECIITHLIQHHLDCVSSHRQFYFIMLLIFWQKRLQILFANTFHKLQCTRVAVLQSYSINHEISFCSHSTSGGQNNFFGAPNF